MAIESLVTDIKLEKKIREKESRNIKKLLLISSAFSPLHGSESIQMLNYTRYLPNFGWFPIVICRKPSSIDVLDYHDLDYIPKFIKIYRCGSIDGALLNFLMRLKSLFSRYDDKVSNSRKSSVNGALFSLLKRLKFLPNRSNGWLPLALIYSLKLLKEEDISVIISRSGSITCHIVALILKTLTGLPWIASFSDPWTTDPNNLYKTILLPPKLAKWYDELLERKVIYSADKIIFTTGQLKNEYLRRFPTISSDHFDVIPNSHDPERVSIHKESEEERKKFTMTYVGSFMKLRSPDPLLKALNMLRKEDNGLNEKIRINFIGDFGSFNYLISKYELTDMVQVISVVPHNEVFRYLYDSDILLLIDNPAHTMCLASKLVEYLFTGKPILAITSKEGAAADVVRSTRTGIVVSPHNIVRIKYAIRSLYSKYSNKSLTINQDWNEINKYTAKKCTDKLVHVIESVAKD